MSPKLPGLGDVDWGRYVSALTDIGYDGFTCIEVEDKAFEGSREKVLGKPAPFQALYRTVRYLKKDAPILMEWARTILPEGQTCGLQRVASIHGEQNSRTIGSRVRDEKQRRPGDFLCAHETRDWPVFHNISDVGGIFRLLEHIRIECPRTQAVDPDVVFSVPRRQPFCQPVDPPLFHCVVSRAFPVFRHE